MIPEQNEYLDFLQYLNAMGVRYAVLHDWESLASGPVSDLDIIVAGKDLQRLETGLCAQYRILTMLHYEASSYGFALARKGPVATPSLIADFTTDYRWGGRIFFSSEELLRHRRQWQEMWVVGPAEEFAYLLVKKIYEKGCIPDAQKRRIEELVRKLGQAARETAEQLFGEKAGGQLIDWILAKQWDDVEAAIPNLQRRLRWQTVKRDPLNPVRFWIPELWRRWRRWHYPTGVSVAVISPKGEKKTRLLGLLKEMLPTAFRRVAVLDEQPRKTGTLRGRVANKLGFLRCVRPLLVRSTLVLLDWDEESFENFSNGDKAASDTLPGNIAPEPDLVMVTGSLRLEAGKSSAAAPLHGRRVFLLDGRLPAEEMAQHAAFVLADYLSERYLRRRKLWFSGQAPQATAERGMLRYRDVL